ncbi:MAG: hypothetical protein DMD88_20375 [Candidatus Rokuibacteriota bacterium]|nr:MAG: hypothetical protein DMD88_20375 [Candidatus Rokubacteria bacterium]
MRDRTPREEACRQRPAALRAHVPPARVRPARGRRAAPRRDLSHDARPARDADDARGGARPPPEVRRCRRRARLRVRERARARPPARGAHGERDRRGRAPRPREVRHRRLARRPRVSREYPEHPRVGVGAVVLHESRVLLVRRGQAPSAGKWSLPGGLVNLGETTREAVAREVAEECGLAIRVGGVAGIVERVVRDEAGRIRYHYVLVDYLAFPESTRLVPGSDAADAQWIEIDRVAELDTTEGLLDMVRRAQALERGDRA